MLPQIHHMQAVSLEKQQGMIAGERLDGVGNGGHASARRRQHHVAADQERWDAVEGDGFTGNAVGGRQQGKLRQRHGEGRRRAFVPTFAFHPKSKDAGKPKLVIVGELGGVFRWQRPVIMQSGGGAEIDEINLFSFRKMQACLTASPELAAVLRETKGAWSRPIR